MAWSPLAGGALFNAQHSALADIMQTKAEETGVDLAAVAVAWLLAHPARIMPVLGTNDLDRISHISDALKVQMDRQSWFEIYQAANGHEVP